MDAKELILNAIDGDGFIPSDTAAGYINPIKWNTMVVDFLQEALVVSNLGRIRNDILGQAGKSFNITINGTPLAAAATATTADASVSAYAVTQKTYTPSEYTFRYQLHDAEARRAFYDVQSDMARKVGYAHALAVDDDCVTVCTAGAGNAIIANSVVSSDIASTDLLDFEEVVRGATEIRKDKMFPYALVVNAEQLGQLSQSTLFVQTLPSGGNTENVLGGKVGRIYGMDVYWTTQLVASSNQVKALMFGQTVSGDKPFGLAWKHMPTIRTQRFEAGRYLDIVGASEFDVVVELANGICTIETYA